MSDLTTLVSQGNAVNLVAAACLTILLYDHAITMDQEIEKMWPTRMSFAKVLFFLNRYPVEAILLYFGITDLIASPPLVLISRKICIFYLRWLTVATTISTSVVQGILVLRVWALHRHNKTNIFIAFFFYFGGVAALIGLVVKDYVGEEVLINNNLASLPGCYATSVPSMIAGFWIGPLIVETILFGLVISRAWWWWRDGMALPKIFKLLARDSTLYFLIVFSMLLSNYLLFQLGPPFLSSLLVTPSTTAGCILGSHMILNLRTAVLQGEDDEDVQTGEPLRWSIPPEHFATTNVPKTSLVRSESYEFATRYGSGRVGPGPAPRRGNALPQGTRTHFISPDYKIREADKLT